MADVNVLIYAFRKDSPHHAICKPWLDAVVDGDARFGVSPLALSAVVRVVTNPRAFVQPSSIEQAFAFCENLLNQPRREIVQPGEGHWPVFTRLCREAAIVGPGVTDAWFAALAIESGCTWITFDRDFGRFPGLNWREPSL